MTQTHTCAIHF